MGIEFKYTVTDVCDGYPMGTTTYTDTADFINGELIICINGADEIRTVYIPKEDLLKLMEEEDGE